MERIVAEYISKPNLGFEFSRGTRSGADIFVCKGAFSLGSYSDMNVLEDAVKKSKSKRVILDFRGIVHIDSSGIGVIASLLKETQASNRDLRMIPSTPVRLALGIAKIDTLMRFDDTLEAALQD